MEKLDISFCELRYWYDDSMALSDIYPLYRAERELLCRPFSTISSRYSQDPFDFLRPEPGKLNRKFLIPFLTAPLHLLSLDLSHRRYPHSLILPSSSICFLLRAANIHPHRFSSRYIHAFVYPCNFSAISMYLRR